jgi:hypothetical protein
MKTCTPVPVASDVTARCGLEGANGWKEACLPLLMGVILLAGAANAFAQGQGNATLTGTIDNVGTSYRATVTATFD